MRYVCLILVVAVGAGLALAITARGDSARVLGEPTVFGTLDQAGFTRLGVVPEASSLVQIGKTFGVRSLASGDIAGTGAVYTRGSRLFLGPVTAVWFSNAATAKRAEAALLNGRPLNDHGHRLQEARMCNVLIASYRRSNDRALDRKFDRAVAFMHENC